MTAWIPACCPEKQLKRDVRLWRQATRTVESEYGELPDECRRYFIIRCIIDLQVKDVVDDDRKAHSARLAWTAPTTSACSPGRWCSTAPTAAH